MIYRILLLVVVVEKAILVDVLRELPPDVDEAMSGVVRLEHLVSYFNWQLHSGVLLDEIIRCKFREGVVCFREIYQNPSKEFGWLQCLE